MPHSVIGRFAGMSKENLEAGFYQYLFKFLNKSRYPIDVSPYSAAHIMNSVKSDFLNLNLIPSLYCFITRAYFNVIDLILFQADLTRAENEKLTLLMDLFKLPIYDAFINSR